MSEVASLEQAWAVVLARPDDLDARQVLADAMLEAGDVHGELIELQLARARGDARRVDIDAREEELLTTHGAALLGDGELRRRLDLGWEAGFVRTVRALGSLDELATLFRAPAGRLVRSLQALELSVPLAQVAVVLKSSAPPTLTELRLGRSSAVVAPVADVAPLLAALPRLERLDVRGLLVDFSAVSSAALRTLEVGSFVNTEPTLTTLGTARLPALKALHVVLSDSTPRFPGAFLSASGFTAVESLALFGYLAPEHLAGLANSPLLARLRQLRLVPTAETGWGDELRRLAPKYLHLERLELATTLDRFTPLRALGEALPNLALDTASGLGGR